MKFIDKEQVMPIEKVPEGEYVRRVRKDGTPFQKVYRKGKYDRWDKAWQCDDQDDISRCILVKKGTKVLVGFTY